MVFGIKIPIQSFFVKYYPKLNIFVFQHIIGNFSLPLRMLKHRIEVILLLHQQTLEELYEALGAK